MCCETGTGDLLPPEGHRGYGAQGVVSSAGVRGAALA